MNALLKRVSLFSIVVAFAIGGFAVAAQGEGIEFSKQEREQLDRALQAMNATVADLGFAKDLGEPRSALKWIRETLEEPLQLNRVGQELWDCAQQDDASNWWSFARRRLELEPISELSISDAITPSVWSNAAPVLADALMQFYAGAQLANLLLDRAFEKLTSEQMQYLAASAFASALNLEDEKASRDALRDAGVEQALIEQMLADSKQLDETPSAEMLLSASERLDRSALLEAGRVFQGAVQTFAEVVRDFTDWPEETLRWETPFGAIVILGRGVNVFDEAALLVVNPGSDTTYRGAAGSANGLSRNRLAAIVDFDGDDLYVGNELLGPGAALFGAAVVLDFNGSDTWRCDFAGTGAGLWGVGWIEDAGGNDIYDARALSQGAAIAGVGVLLDRAGNDSYRVGWQGQGFAGWMGFGLLLDRAGADRYFAGGYVLDYERNPDRYLSLSQGFSIGQRPFSGGGIGALLDLEGNDVYDADVFAQGVSYYYSAGFLLDGSGHDRYSVHHYGQGCGIHLSLGLLVDVAGDDVYKGSTLTQGAAHDFAVGGLMDRGGDDTYIAKQNSQGHGMNNSVGWLLDAAGDDVYEGRDSDSTQGIGNTGGTRESGSIGLLLDLGGTDRYSSPGVNDRLLLRPNYGALYDVNSVSVREGEE